MRLSGFISRRSALIIVLLLVIATTISVISYEYSIQASANISNLSTDDIHSNTQIEASDLGHILGNDLEAVSTNLNLIASSNPVTTENLTSALSLFISAQNSTKSLTYDYFWMDQNGRLLIVSNGSTYLFGTGKDLSGRAFFSYPRDVGTTYFSSATPSLNNASIEYIFVSRPVYATQNNSQLGNFVGVVAAAIDLRTLGRSLQTVLSPQFRSSIGLLDSKGGILYSSNESLIGQSIFGSSVQNALPPDLKPQFDSFLNLSLSGQSGFEDISYKGASGTLAYQPIFVNATSSNGNQVLEQFGVLYVTASDALASSAVALINQERFVSLVTILGVVGVSGGVAITALRWNKRLDDVVKEKTSELLAANEELAAKARAEKDLIDITAHELRTPTQSILVNTEMLRNVIRPILGLPQNLVTDELVSELQPIEIVEIVESSYRNARRLQKLTQNILAVARIDNKTSSLELEEFDLNEIAKDAVDDCRSFLNAEMNQSSNIQILFEPKQQALPVTADKTKIEEVITNLLNNAVKFTKEGGRIIVTTDKENDSFAVVRIKDDGIGIDPEILPNLFSKFATKSGTGLGLYISKSYVEAHGGTIEGRNDLDGGATFSFTIPLAAPHLKDKQLTTSPYVRKN